MNTDKYQMRPWKNLGGWFGAADRGSIYEKQADPRISSSGNPLDLNELACPLCPQKDRWDKRRSCVSDPYAIHHQEVLEFLLRLYHPSCRVRGRAQWYKNKYGQPHRVARVYYYCK